MAKKSKPFYWIFIPAPELASRERDTPRRALSRGQDAVKGAAGQVVAAVVNVEVHAGCDIYVEHAVYVVCTLSNRNQY